MSQRIQYRPDLGNCGEVALFAGTPHDVDSCAEELGHADLEFWIDTDKENLRLDPNDWLVKDETCLRVEIRSARADDDRVTLAYLDPPFYSQKDYGHFNDKWDSLQIYVDWLTRECVRAWDSLAANGNFVLHLDWHAVHYMKVALDKAFGYDKFQNEIIWNYNSGGASKMRLSRKHDTLLWYTRDPKSYVFNLIREPYATPNVAGRPGFHPEGRILTDVWSDISFISTTSSERCGYPTQKPVKLLERIVTLFTEEGDTVLDPLCGSGTTGVAAASLGRQWIMQDKNPEAIRTAKERLSL